MRSRHRVRGAVIGVLALALSAGGCGLRFQENATQAPMPIGKNELGCLDGAMDQLRDFVAGKGQASKVHELARCADRALEMFGQNARGQDENSFTAQELRAFVERYYLRQSSVAPEALNALMEIKSVLVGGEAGRLTKLELIRTRALLKLLDKQVDRLAPFLPLDELVAPGVQTPRVDEAAEALRSSLTELSRFAAATRTPYQPDRVGDWLRALLPEISGLPAQDLERYVQGYEAWARAFVVNPRGKARDGIWPRLMLQVGDWGALGLRAMHFHNRYDAWACGEGLKRLRTLSFQALSLVHKSFAIRQEGTISIDELEDLLKFGFPPAMKVRDTSIRESLHPLLARLFKEAEPVRGLTRVGVAEMRDALARWFIGQDAIEQAFVQSGPFACHPTTPVENGRFESTRTMEQMWPAVVSRSKEVGAPVRAEIFKVLAAHQPIFEPGNNVASFLGKNRDDYSFDEATRVHLVYSATRLFFAGYDASDARYNSATRLTRTQFHRAYLEFYDIGVDLGWFDRRIRDGDLMRFREADMLTPAANGDQYISTSEAIDMILTAFSGRALGQRIHLNIGKLCPQKQSPPELDMYDIPKIPRDCYFGELFKRFSAEFSHFPMLVIHYANLDANQKAQFERAVMGVSTTAFDKDLIESTTSEKIGGVMHYLELFFAIYDKDHSGTVSYEESMPAYQKYRYVLAELSSMDKDFLLRGAFTYMMKYGEIPTPNWSGAGWFLIWLGRVHWSYEADRTVLVRIFAALSTRDPPPEKE